MNVRKAVFPAAGLGTRFLPATKAQPKEMLPLVDKPTIQYVVEEAVASGLVGDHHRHRPQQARDRGSLRRRLRARVLPERPREDRGAGPDQDHLRAGLGVLRAPEGAARPRPRHPVRPHAGGRRAVRRVPRRRHHRRGAARRACASSSTSSSKYNGPVIAVERVPRERIHQYGVIAGRNIGGNVWEIADLVEKPRRRGCAVRPGHHRPLRADARSLRHPGRDRRRPPRRDPAHRRPAHAAQAPARCTRWSSRASATTPATSSASSRRPWSSRWPDRTWPMRFGSISRASGSSRTSSGGRPNPPSVCDHP